MFRTSRIGYSLIIAVALIAFVSVTTQAQNRRPRTVNTTPPSLELSATPGTLRVCAGEPATVQLNARATSQNGNGLRYRWATEGGRLDGDGPNPVWDLSGMQPGTYRATVEVDSGTDDSCAAFSSASVVVNDCVRPAPVCPSVTISCPDSVLPDQPITFRANVSGAAFDAAYNWTVTGGRITDGQGTRAITVDAVGLAGQTVTATLNVRAAGLDCPASCAVQIPLPKLDCRKFDEFPNLPRNEEKARLDNFAIDLQNSPGSTAYVVVYPRSSGRPGEAEQHTNRVVDYLVSYRGLDASRIIKLIGPTREVLAVELWSCPPGVRPSGLIR